jgi:hypothetical protein
MGGSKVLFIETKPLENIAIELSSFPEAVPVRDGATKRSKMHFPTVGCPNTAA